MAAGFDAQSLVCSDLTYWVWYHIVSKAVASQNVMKLLTKEVSVEVLTAGSPTHLLLEDIQWQLGNLTSFDQLGVVFL